MVNVSALAAQLGILLKKQQLMLVLAESCTGGMVSQIITSVPGSSAWFDRGFITYSNQSKIDLLNVSNATLAKYGAVSEQTAHEMAQGALLNTLQSNGFIKANQTLQPDVLSINKPIFDNALKKNLHTGHLVDTGNLVVASITGIAGPATAAKRGGQANLNLACEKPVGLICFGFAVNNRIMTNTQHFKGTRRQIRLQSSAFLLSQLIELLKTAV